jgi:hypothetical protein
MAEPPQGVVVLVGGGIPINELIPPLFISVAPRGMVPPLRLVAVPGEKSGDAIPLDETVPDEGTVQPLVVVDPTPPPSNVEVVPLIPDAAPPAIPDEDEEPAAQPRLLELIEPVELLEPPGPVGSGLRPPDSTEVAPSGIPVWRGDDMEPGMPSGDVTPRPGELITLCARLISQVKRITAPAISNRRI